MTADRHPTQLAPEVIYADPAARGRALHLGMWIFLGSETLLFAGLFALYAAYRAAYPDTFTDAIHHNELWIGSVNTVVLIVSSFCVAFTIHAVRTARRRLALVTLGLALALGTTFLVLKGVEYAHHLADGIAPGRAYSSTELPSAGAHRFFDLYYAMTGLHALHVVAGLAILGWFGIGIVRRRVTREHHTGLELGGLYWHLVDLVWIFLWPLLYLMGASS